MIHLLIIGGSGLLGTEIRKQLSYIRSEVIIDSPPHTKLDITYRDSIKANLIIKSYDAIVLLASEKDQTRIEIESSSALTTNIVGVSNVVAEIQKNNIQAKLVYISTGYVYKGNSRYHKETDGVFPCNKYAWSKLGGECAVRMLDEDKHLIIRCEFSKAPWHRDGAYVDQFTSREELSITASKIISLIFEEASGTYNIGGKRRSVWKYACSISDKPIRKESRKNSKLIKFPKDTSLDVSKFNKFMEGV
jgi:dTDP-4-dehydrorhamnose reductase